MRQVIRWVALFFCFVLSLAVLSHVAEAQIFNVLHNFTGGPDGSGPWGQLAMDQAGSLYIGTEEGGISPGYGAVDKIKPISGNWILQPLYDFKGPNHNDGSSAQIVLASNGVVYGATTNGGTNGSNCGTVFQLRPPATPPPTSLAPWDETILYSFQGGNDGCAPESAPIIDSAGNLYGTTPFGGANTYGVVYELVRSGESYTEQILYTFSGSDGKYPYAGLIADSTFTNLYGVTEVGGAKAYGAVFRLTNTGSGWTESILYSFQNIFDGEYPMVGLAMDSSGNLYGATSSGSPGRAGSVFQLTPSGGEYSLSILYNGSFGCAGLCVGPSGGYLTSDSTDNIYGMTHTAGVYGAGSVFELIASVGGYTYTDLHDFTGGLDGGYPVGGVIRDAAGNLYGTTQIGGEPANGIVFQIAPSQSLK